MKFQGQILARVPRRRELDQRESRLPTAWIRESRVPPLPSTSVLLRDAGAFASSAPAGDTVIVMLSGECEGAQRALVSAAQAGARIYVLAPPGWDGGGPKGLFASMPRASVLVRRVRELPASAVWSPAGSCVWTGSAVTKPSWRVTLNASQAHSLRLAMLQLFWHHGLDEAWNDQGTLAFRPCGDRPFDVPDAATDAPVRLLRRTAIEPSLEGEMVYAPNATPRPRATIRAWLAPSGHDHISLAELRASGAEVVWHDLDLPACSLTHDRGLLRASSSQWSMPVALDSAQRADLERVLSSEPSWRFAVDAALGDIERSPGAVVWLPGSSTPTPLRALETLDAGEASADSLRSCATTEPAARPAPSPLSLQVEVAWRVLPPSTPSVATDDPLVQAWRRFDDRFKSRIDAALRSVEEASASSGILERAFESLRAALLGFGRTSHDLKKRIEALAATAPSSLGPTGASSLLASLREIEGELSALRRGLSTVENQAREARDREEQRQTFDKKIADTRASLDVHIKELETKSAELDETEKILAEIAAAPPAGPKEKDRKAAQRRYGDTQQQLKSRVQRLRELIDEGRRKLDEPFEYRPSTSAVTSSGTGRPAGAAFVPAAGADDDLRAPTDPLPSVGRLVVAGKQRYLGIQRWEDLDVAEQEAARLSARLVAEVAAP